MAHCHVDGVLPLSIMICMKMIQLILKRKYTHMEYDFPLNAEMDVLFHAVCVSLKNYANNKILLNKIRSFCLV